MRLGSQQTADYRIRPSTTVSISIIASLPRGCVATGRAPVLGEEGTRQGLEQRGDGGRDMAFRAYRERRAGGNGRVREGRGRGREA